MASQTRGVVPPSMDRPKRIAKRLQKIYGEHSLSTCQAVTAHLYFHKDWHALEEAVKNKASSAPFLEDLSIEEIEKRTRQQMFIICNELAGIDPNANYAPPPDLFGKGSYEKDDFSRRVFASDAQLPDRERASRGRYHLKMAGDVIFETVPTSRDVPRSFDYFDLIPLCSKEHIAGLPRKIAQWWSVNIPHQDVVSEQWRQMELDPNNCISVLNAGGYWSALSHHYGRTIDWTMVMGISYLFAGRYASNKAQELESFNELVSIAIDKEHPVEERKRVELEIDKLLTELIAEFLDVMPRDDLGDIFREQPQALILNAKDCLGILSDPNSRKGIWGR